MKDLYNYYDWFGIVVIYTVFWTTFFIVAALLGEGMEERIKAKLNRLLSRFWKQIYQSLKK